MRLRRSPGGPAAWVRAVLGLALVAVSGGLVAGSASGERPVAWQQVRPGAGTLCGRGGPFAFWAHRASPERLLVYFEGGGFCWDHRSCTPAASQFKDRVGDEENPARRGTGILDLADPRNPFRGWTVVYVPSCTGDLHAGASTRTYPAADGRAVTVHHHGHVNASAALDWTFRHVPQPTQVVVAGCSAGSAGSLLHAPRIIERYPHARVAQLGDSLGYLLSKPGDLRPWQTYAVLPEWIPAVRRLHPGRITTPRLYAAVAGHYQTSTFAQVNFRQDAVQRHYQAAAGGRAEDFDHALLGNLAEIRDSTPNFRSCLLDGSEHCALSSGRFYGLRSGGTSLHDWVADLAAGRDVTNLPPA